MQSAILFDTHAYVKKLEAGGFTSAQAEVQVEALAGWVDEYLATKLDLRELELRLTVRLGAMITAGIAIVAVLVKIL